MYRPKLFLFKTTTNAVKKMAPEDIKQMIRQKQFAERQTNSKQQIGVGRVTISFDTERL